MASIHNYQYMLIVAAMLSALPALASPENDRCPLATQIGGTGAYVFDNRLADTDGPAHDACAFGTVGDVEKDVWFCWTAPEDGPVAIETCDGTTADTRLAVYEGCSCPAADAALIGCNDDSCVYQSRVEFTAAAGTAYLVRVGVHPGLGGAEGTLTISYPDNVPPSCGAAADSCTPRDPWNGYASDRTTFTVVDDFSPAEDGTITQVCWWGTYFDGVAGCTPASDAFEIRYYADAGGLPGDLIAGPFRQADGTLLLDGRIGTGASVVATLSEIEYSASHEAVNVAAAGCYWIEIANRLDEECAWYWETASGPTHWSLQRPGNGGGYAAEEAVAEDLAFCVGIPLMTDSSSCFGSPPNDACEQALPIQNEATFFDTSRAVMDGPDEPGCGFDFDDPELTGDIWFSYTAECTGTVEVTLCDSRYDTKIAAYVGTCPTGEAAIACSDDICGDDFPLYSEMSFDVTVGEVYLIRVGGFNGDSGTGLLNLTLSGPDCNANDIIDGCDLAYGKSVDCNSNGIPDECDIVSQAYQADTGWVAPVANGHDYHIYADTAPLALDAPSVTIEVVADLDEENEWIRLWFNETVLGRLFLTNGTLCPDEPDVQSIPISLSSYNEAVLAGSADIRAEAADEIGLQDCIFSSLRMTLSYPAAPFSADCNANTLPDECEPGDFDGDGGVDLADYAAWPGCMTGPGGALPGGCCSLFDFEPDADVDLADFAGMQAGFSRP